MQEVTLDAGTLMANHGPRAGDEALTAWFYIHPRPNRLKTLGGTVEMKGEAAKKLLAELDKLEIKYEVDGNTIKVEGAGRPIFDDVEYIHVSSGGDRLNIKEQPATRGDKIRFATQYAAFKSGQTEAVSGTPLSEWTLISKSQAEELKHFHIRTVEQLASMPDGNISNVGNISHLKKQAGDFLALAKGQAPTIQLRAELEKRDAAMEALQLQMKEQAAIIAKLSAPTDDAEPAKRGRGRPRKEEADANF